MSIIHTIVQMDQRQIISPANEWSDHKSTCTLYIVQCTKLPNERNIIQRMILTDFPIYLHIYLQNMFAILFGHDILSFNINLIGYDAVSDVVESGVHWRSDFQIGSRVLKICFKPILMHIYGMQYDFMHRSC